MCMLRMITIVRVARNCKAAARLLVHANNFWRKLVKSHKRRGGALLAVAAYYISRLALSKISMTHTISVFNKFWGKTLDCP